jgi:hypothetical protein
MQMIAHARIFTASTKQSAMETIGLDDVGAQGSKRPDANIVATSALQRGPYRAAQLC